MIEGLRHDLGYLFNRRDEQFFEDIDKAGGWPLGYKYVGFEHTSERRAGFTNTPISTGHWTTLYSSDDYYFWKLSDEAKQKIIKSVVSDCRAVFRSDKLTVSFYR